MNELLRKALQVEVTLVRVPLQVLDERVAARYAGERSRVRQTLQAALGVVDQAALLLSHPESMSAAARDTTTPAPEADERLSTPETDEQPSEPEVDEQPSEPEAAPTPKPAPGEPMPADELERVEELAAELVAEQDEETFAGELADDDELRRVQAELQAKHRVEEAVEDAGSGS